MIQSHSIYELKEYYSCHTKTSYYWLRYLIYRRNPNYMAHGNPTRIFVKPNPLVVIYTFPVIQFIAATVQYSDMSWLVTILVSLQISHRKNPVKCSWTCISLPHTCTILWEGKMFVNCSYDNDSSKLCPEQATSVWYR